MKHETTRRPKRRLHIYKFTSITKLKLSRELCLTRIKLAIGSRSSQWDRQGPKILSNGLTLRLKVLGWMRKPRKNQPLQIFVIPSSTPPYATWCAEFCTVVDSHGLVQAFEKSLPGPLKAHGLGGLRPNQVISARESSGSQN
jgi:hypothetical protein